MEPLLIVAAAAGGLAVVQRLRGRKRAARWAETAAACGLTDVESFSSALRWWVTARQGLLTIRIDEHLLQALQVRIRGLADITLRCQGLTDDSGRSARREDLRTGDPVFDEALVVLGPEYVVRALLDEDTRRQVIDLFDGKLDERKLNLEVTVAAGDLMVLFREELGHERHPDALRALLGVAVRLTSPSRPLANIARDDPRAEVRAGVVRLLAFQDSLGEPVDGAIAPERLHALMETAMVTPIRRFACRRRGGWGRPARPSWRRSRLRRRRPTRRLQAP